MKPEIKEKLVTALRSGEYIQGTGYLNNNGCFCCLGVLTDLFLKEKGLDWKFGYLDSNIKHNDGHTACLSPAVAQWAGIDVKQNPNNDLGPYVTIDKVNCSLASHNDDGKTFYQIATAIEEQL